MTQSQRNSITAVWQDIHTHLDSRKRAVTQEIRNYPQPIAGCDAQIPALWEARDALVRELNRLEDVAHDADAIEAFIAASDCLDDDRKRMVRDALKTVRATTQTHAAAE